MRTKRKIIILILVFTVLFILSIGVIIKERHLKTSSQTSHGMSILSNSTNKTYDISSDRTLSIEDENLSLNSLNNMPKENEVMDKIDSSFALILREDNGLIRKEDSCNSRNNTESIENKLFKRSPRLISFEVKEKSSTGEYLFSLLRKTIDNICSCSPSGGRKYEKSEITSDHIGLINHYMKSFRILVYKLEVMYSDGFELENIYTPYSDSIDCFTGIKLTRYHTADSFTKNEQRYTSYINQFVDTEAANIPINVEGKGQSCLNVRDHIVYTLLHYVCLFYLKSWKTIDMLYTKLNVEKLSASNVDLSKIINGYKYKDIIETVRPIHFVNTNGCIVRPLIME
ncbi:hypothetical protein EROM_101700 [Encephalitozoon romaleae SJ-2008]|uniref:Uncharacterized protein n=1 Tax=Encephalitozoon romaleae (strain SJ-2008) TaxID=1178016 RepID=I7AGS2_ENCRO|nr:hypothetical protein EROM_101700 [Encephalitozoon romaleae SJ-2008]AFN83985.1 hypothetical protein EROM_101700 [Encephalitozoon romaleae SJ-2008]